MESLENKRKSNKNLIGHSKEKKQDLSVRTEEKIKTGNTEEKNHVDEIGSMVEGEVAKETVLPSWMCESEAYEPNIDKDGFIFLTGRQKDMIVLKNGKKVFPEELETLINRLELVKECIVYGMPDEKDKNDLKLSVKIVYDKDVVKEKYPNTTEEELRKIIWEQIKEINKTFPPYKYIKNMILTDQELIKTTTQKIKRQEEIKKILGSTK